jgi:hypothetical protein
MPSVTDKEPIEFSKWPIWDLQDDEDSEAFIKFQKYFLPGIKPSITQAWRRYVADEQSKNVLTANNPDQNGGTPDLKNSRLVPKGSSAGVSFVNWEKVYRWQERHRAYWQKRQQDDLAWREHQQRECQVKVLGITSKLLQRADEIASMPTVNVDTVRTYEDGRAAIQHFTARPSKDFVDAVVLLKECVSLINNLGCQNDLDKAYQQVTKAGFEVIDPTLLVPQNEPLMLPEQSNTQFAELDDN